MHIPVGVSNVQINNSSQQGEENQCHDLSYRYIISISVYILSANINDAHLDACMTPTGNNNHWSKALLLIRSSRLPVDARGDITLDSYRYWWRLASREYFVFST